MERRELLKQAGVAAGAGAAGVGGIAVYDTLDGSEDGEPVDPDVDRGRPREAPRSAVPDRYAEQFGTIVDVVEAGADPTGEEPINSFLARYAASDTLMVFEPGTYRLAPGLFSGLRRFGFLGIGEERPTIQPTSSRCHPGDAHLSFEAVEEFLLEDVDFEFQQDGTGGSIHLFADGDVGVRNVRVSGDCPDQIAVLRIDVRDPEAEATFENLSVIDERRDTQLTGLYVGKQHAGSVTFEDCTIRGFSDNGLYASAPGRPAGGDGSVTVLGGTYADNNIANVRLGSTGSVARGVTVDVASPAPLDGSLNARGIRLRDGADHVVEDCRISIDSDAGRSIGAIVFHPDAGTATVRETTVEVDADDTVGVNAMPPSESGVEGPLLENVTVSGRAASAYAAVLAGRDGTVFRNCEITGNGHDRGGIRLVDASDCRIVDSEIRTTGPPIDLRGASATVENTTIATAQGRRTIDSLEASDEVLTP